MPISDTSIIARFVQSVSHLRAPPAPPVEKVIQRFGRPYLTQLTANGNDLATAMALLRQAYVSD